MSWEEIKKDLSDDNKAFIDSEIKKLTDNVQKLEQSNRIATEKADEAISGRQKLKDMLKNITGESEVTEDSITKAFNKKGGDEALKNEIENWKQKHESLVTENSTKVSEYESKLKDMALTNTLRDLGIDGISSSSKSASLLLEELKQGATLDGDKIVYKNEDGTTQFAGSDIMTPDVKLESLKANKDYAPFFKPDVLSGGSANPSSGGSQTTVGKIDGTKAEQEAYIANKFNLNK